MTERFCGVPMRVWAGVEALAAAIGVLALLIGGSFAVLEYLDRQRAARAAETLDMIEIWETRGAQDAYLVLSAALAKRLEALSDEELDPARTAVLQSNLARRVFAETGLEPYEAVDRYFTRLALCIEAKLCDEAVARTFFDDTVRSFVQWFASERVRRREGFFPSHGLEVEALAKQFASKSAL